MSQFAQSGSAMDDAQSSDGDVGFIGVNQRLQLNQLQPGEVSESLNGRIEGFWKPRRGIVEKTSAFTTGSSPLALPFYLIDTPKTISAATVPVAGTVRITVTGHGFGAGSQGWARISGLDAAVSGDYLLTRVDANTLEYSVAGVTSIVDGVGTLQQMPINDAANANVRASCLFSDPNTNDKEYVIIALDSVAKKVDLETFVATDIPYPTGQSLGAKTDMIQVFDKVMLFRDGKQAFEWYPNGRPVLAASKSGSTTVTMRVVKHGLLAGASVTIAGLTGTSAPNGTYVVASVVDQDTFTFVASPSQTITYGVANATMTDGFTLSPGGTYVQPQTFNANGSNITSTGGLVSMTVSGNVTLNAGDVVVVYECSIPEFSSLVGKEFVLTNATTTLLQFYAPVPDVGSGSSSVSIEVGGQFSVGAGFMHQPGAPWGVYFQRRLWVPFYYDQSGAYNAVTFTSRGITDEITASDILDTTTFDQIANQFRISGGTADHVVAMHGFYDDSLIVLNRNSLHLVAGTQGSLNDTVVKELTSEVGCLARKTVVMKGNAMFFLADDGVYAVEFIEQYNLRGADEPISKNIQPYIDRINRDLAGGAVATLYENRYYLAVPLDSVVGAGDARGNNAILVFNFLNKAWESLDTFGDSRFLIEDFIVGSAADRNNIYAVTSNGGLHQLEAEETSNDRFNVSNVGSSLVTVPINAKLTTRGYSFNNLDRKRFTDVQVNIQALQGQQAEYNLQFAAEDPDAAEEIGTTTQFLGGEVLSPSGSNESETASIRCRLGGVRGFTGTMILTRTIGSPRVNSVKVTGSITNRQIISQK
jgi:hypothetical protein